MPASSARRPDYDMEIVSNFSPSVWTHQHQVIKAQRDKTYFADRYSGWARRASLPDLIYLLDLDTLSDVQRLFESTLLQKLRATNWRELIQARSSLFLYKQEDLRKEFEHHRLKWQDETGFLSSITDRVLHPSYQRIIGMGRQVIPLLLSELERNPDYWFWALSAVSGENPVQFGSTFDEAVQGWLKWGREKGYTW